MDDFLKNPTKFDPLAGYKILNTIKPKYFQTGFPYSEITPANVTFTQKKIEIIAKKVDAFKKSRPPRETRGGTDQPNAEADLPPIMIYG